MLRPFFQSPKETPEGWPHQGGSIKFQPAARKPAYVIATNDFIRLAEYIAAKRKPLVKVPVYFTEALNRAIKNQKKHSIVAASLTDSKEANNSHSHFVGVLEHVRKGSFVNEQPYPSFESAIKRFDNKSLIFYARKTEHEKLHNQHNNLERGFLERKDEVSEEHRAVSGSKYKAKVILPGSSCGSATATCEGQYWTASSGDANSDVITFYKPDNEQTRVTPSREVSLAVLASAVRPSQGE
ncbi:hypothetical protein IWX90DRAFT_492109 [Phyllosticta citrichinensis]|uniref:DUF6604 domain-containing protein n=1 Tax=Phyllosticta citrichinensis TaxID=1130410 RepID=A0ABR1Y6S3_9PEZI